MPFTSALSGLFLNAEIPVGPSTACPSSVVYESRALTHAVGYAFNCWTSGSSGPHFGTGAVAALG